jgi:phage baseplate assembly protein W
MTIYGPTWPLSNGEADLFKMNATLPEQIKFELKNLLLTSPGENLSDFDYGVGLRTFIFDQNTPTVRSRISTEIRSQISRYMPSVNLLETYMPMTDSMIDTGQMSVVIRYNVIGQRSTDELEINLFSNQGASFL